MGSCKAVLLVKLFVVAIASTIISIVFVATASADSKGTTTETDTTYEEACEPHTDVYTVSAIPRETVETTDEEYISCDESETIAETDDSRESEEESYHPLYSVNGAVLDESLQAYIYDLFVQFDVPAEYFPLWIAELYQENQFRHSASASGLDYGYCQLRIRYHEEMAIDSGCWTTDLINDPYANLYVGTWLIAKRYHDYGDWNTAVMYYYNSGSYEANIQYLRDVSQWYSKIERLK